MNRAAQKYINAHKMPNATFGIERSTPKRSKIPPATINTIQEINALHMLVLPSF
jgi:hypothetical protein